MTIQRFDRVYVKTRGRYGRVTECKPIGGGLYVYRVILENSDDQRLYASAFIERAIDQKPGWKSNGAGVHPLRLVTINGSHI